MLSIQDIGEVVEQCVRQLSVVVKVRKLTLNHSRQLFNIHFIGRVIVCKDLRSVSASDVV